jgi:serine/threonine protein kinase
MTNSNDNPINKNAADDSRIDPSSSTKSSKSTGKSSFPNLSELRNQMTIVSGTPSSETSNDTNPKSQTTDGYSQSNPSQIFNLPFVVEGFIATSILAQGGMSVTYLGNKIDDETQQVVVKIPRLDSTRTVEMFRNECHVLEQFSHPGIVPILAYGDTVIQNISCPFMVMKYVSGQSLRQRLKSQGKLSWKEASQVLDDVASALQYLYENNFCHRDIKPDNIIFDQDLNRWVLVDFGIAKSMQDNIMMTMTLVGQDSGTWDYMPPEQLEGKAVDIRCDIYALGTVIWESLIGTVPRRGTKLPSQHGLELSEDVDVLIAKMVEHDINDRYQSPEEVLNALHKGAKKVEQWVRVRKTVKGFSRIALFIAVTIAILSIIWISGNWIYAAKAHEIYEKNKSSATIALRELNIFKKNCPLFWGHRHINELVEINQLVSKAKQEQEKMLEEYNGIQSAISNTDGTIEELTSRSILANNFIKKWDNQFKGAKELISAQSALNNLQSTIQQLEDNKLVSETISMLEAKLNGDDKNFRSLLAECRKVEGQLRTAEAKSKMTEFSSKIRSAAIGDRLPQIDTLISSSSFQDLSKAYSQLKDLEDIIGPDDIVSQKMTNIDDKYWTLCETASNVSLRNNNYSQAKRDVRTYMENGFSRHRGDAEKKLTSIEEQQQRAEWNVTIDDCNKFMKDNNYKAALNVLVKFEGKYPDTKINISENKKIVADNYAKYVYERRTDLDDYIEAFDGFVEIFPQESESISTLRRFLVWSVHNETSKILFESELEWSVKRDKLVKIKYTRCDQGQRQYLDKLISTAQNYAANPTLSNRYAYLYYFQRPPADCVRMRDKPTIFDVTITYIKVNLSYSHYNELKGWNHCNPEIKIGKKGYDPWWTITGPEDKYEFSFTKEYNFWWNIEDVDLFLQIGDADHSPVDAGTYTGTLDAAQLKTSNSTSWKWNNGTTMEIKWTTK